MLMVYIFSIPFQKRIEFINVESFRYSTFIDYTTVLLYVVDAIFVATFLFFVIGHLLQKTAVSSIFHYRYFRFLLLFLILLVPSLRGGSSLVSLSFYFQICIAVSFSLLVSLQNKTFRRSELLLYPIVLGGVFQSVIAISQFIFQRSLGLWFLGESPYAINSLNVAKIFVNDTTFVRAYGTFPHPNVLAAFLVISLAASFVLLYLRRQQIVQSILKTLLWCLFFLLQFVGLLFTFSRSGWLMAIPTVVVILIYVFYQNERNEKNESSRLKIRSILVIVAIACCFVLWLSRSFILSRAVVADNHGDNAISERVLLLNVSRETISRNWSTGTGLHTFLQQIEAYSTSHQTKLQNWQYQPVHNMYLLIMTETGIIGFGGFAVLLVYVFTSSLRSIKKQPAENRILLLFSCSGILSYLLIGLIDHHPWDIHQSLLLLFFLLGFSTGVSDSKSVSRETL